MSRGGGGAPGEWLERYLDYLAAEKGLAPNTLAAYSADLKRLEASLGGKRMTNPATKIALIA